jgi:hypothetical protein
VILDQQPQPPPPDVSPRTPLTLQPTQARKAKNPYNYYALLFCGSVALWPSSSEIPRCDVFVSSFWSTVTTARWVDKVGNPYERTDDPYDK